MKIGDVIESAIWLNGEESLEDRIRYEADVRRAITRLCDDLGFLHGPVTFIEKRPGNDRVPPVPDHVQGSRVRMLIGEAMVVSLAPEEKPYSFVANLDCQDLKLLRKITREAHAKCFPGAYHLMDAEVDEVIEAASPDAALDTLRQMH